jgi:putative transposase
MVKGFSETINVTFSQTRIQLCIVHMVRHFLKYVSWEDDKAVTQGLKQIYRAPTEELTL